MKALVYREYGGPDVLSVTEFPEPRPAAGQIRIRVKAASINPIDWKQMAGLLAGGAALDSPEVPGRDASGYADEIGVGVTGVAIGDEVFGLGERTHAEFALLTAWAHKPPALDWSVAAAAGVAGETSQRSLDLLGVSPGDVLFIDGGAGGIGAVAVQLAIVRGATVIASCGPANDDYLRQLGAQPVRYGDGLVERVRAAAGSNTVDAVFDAVGKTPAEELVTLVPTPGQVVTIANFQAAGVGARVTTERRPQAAEGLAALAQDLVDSRVVITVQTYPFDRAAEAMTLSIGGHLRGKLVLLP